MATPMVRAQDGTYLQESRELNKTVAFSVVQQVLDCVADDQQMDVGIAVADVSRYE